jgi:hypothetical protein
LELLQQLNYLPSSLQGDEQCRAEQEDVGNLPEKSTGIWLGQYESYIAHLEEDLVEYARKSSALPPTTVSSKTPTAASIVFEIDLQDSLGVCPRQESSLIQPLRVMVSAGKALESREMFVRVRSQLDENCSIVFGVQGGLEKYLGEVADSGPYILLEGRCWFQAGGADSRIEIPSGWDVLPSQCHGDILRFLSRSQGELLHLEEDSDSSDETPQRCVLRPNYIFESHTSPDEASSPSTLAPTSSSKFRNNAYIEILGALLRNDRSYFTTTEVSQSRSRMTLPVAFV